MTGTLVGITRLGANAATSASVPGDVFERGRRCNMRRKVENGRLCVMEERHGSLSFALTLKEIDDENVAVGSLVLFVSGPSAQHVYGAGEI
ncbi:hypothetical protein [Maioricimonas sp. JC845]|uniref:hypothetical protein n=1 Tax=Maioricimonas sp. JC845 TaxID=3232138 RepID=UPI00345B21A0